MTGGRNGKVRKKSQRGHIQAVSPDSRHGLVDGLDAVSHGELVHCFLRHIIKIDFPRVVSTRVGDLHHPLSQHIVGMMEKVLEEEETFHSCHLTLELTETKTLRHHQRKHTPRVNMCTARGTAPPSPPP